MVAALFSRVLACPLLNTGEFSMGDLSTIEGGKNVAV
jgi:hypothetical protein